MENFIHQENLALYRRRLAEPQDEAQRKLLLKLIAEEEANCPILRSSSPGNDPSSGELC
ncbi:hypothetical protein SAMN05444158_1492 [Bradyrhizobium canariense]|uniref:Uncharacterized protein n=1 Tax=Bradyrhizobium canariense TaxID=255045 RepID=A0A1H1QQ57_9BRAD|nr:hypothetical protein SAMN05444158_1492 [Bradyrhizobium canariense]